MFVSKILPGCAICTLTTPMSSSFSYFTPLSQLIRSLRIRNERTRPGYVRSQSYDPVECVAEVMQSEICPRFFVNSFSPLYLFKADCEAEELVQGLHLVSFMKGTGLEKDSPAQVYQEYVMSLLLRPRQKQDSSLRSIRPGKWFAFLDNSPQRGRDGHCGNEVETLRREIETKKARTKFN